MDYLLLLPILGIILAIFLAIEILLYKRPEFIKKTLTDILENRIKELEEK